MSHGSHHEPADASGGHDHHHFDGTPADDAAPDEPRTPGWLTLVGVGLVLTVFLALALRHGDDDKTRAELASEAASAAPSAPPPAPATGQARPASARPSPTAGNPAGLPSGFPAPRLGMSGFRPMPRPPAAAAPGGAPVRPPAAPPAAPAH